LAVPVSDSRTLRTLRLVAASLVALVSLTLLASAASATTQPYGNTVPTVQGTTTVPETPKQTTPTVLAETQTRGMAFTGSDVIAIVAIGGGAVAIGTALVLAARRRRPELV
jgi:hypothetical protein